MMKNILSEPKPVRITVGHQAIADIVSDNHYALEMFGI